MNGGRCYLGLAATLHDPALAIVDGSGEAVFAEAAERFLQDKRAYNAPPDHMIRAAELVREHCSADAELVVAVSWSAGLLRRLRLGAVAEVEPLKSVLGPFLDRFYRRRDPFLWPFADFKALAASMSSSLGQAAVNLRWRGVVPREHEARRYDHHLTHAAAACYTSPFEEAVCAVVDGFGEWTSTSCYHYRRGELRRLRRQGFWGSWRRGSLGMFYAMLCALCGFDPIRGEEWKVMGLAAYGEVDPRLYELLRPLLAVDGLEIVIGSSAADYRSRLRRLEDLRRAPGSPPLEAADLARTGQQVFGELMGQLLQNLHRLGLSDNLVLGGGCALNSSYNGRVLEETPFARLHVPPAPADDGCALGAALLARHEDQPAGWPGPGPLTPYLGSDLDRETLRQLLCFGGLQSVQHLPDRVTRRTAELLAEGKIVGWMQGRAELGPRALGNRSILADPRSPEMKDRINAEVKYREEFRPFAPAILHEHGGEYFAAYQESPYMERTLVFRPEVRRRVPAVVHADGTGRLQSVRRERSEKLHRLLRDFHEITGVPLLLNTSFNVMGKPIVHSVKDAVAAFMTTGLDVLVIDDYLIEKSRAAPR